MLKKYRARMSRNKQSTRKIINRGKKIRCEKVRHCYLKSSCTSDRFKYMVSTLSKNKDF